MQIGEEDLNSMSGALVIVGFAASKKVTSWQFFIMASRQVLRIISAIVIRIPRFGIVCDFPITFHQC